MVARCKKSRKPRRLQTGMHVRVQATKVAEREGALRERIASPHANIRDGAGGVSGGGRTETLLCGHWKVANAGAR